MSWQDRHYNQSGFGGGSGPGGGGSDVLQRIFRALNATFPIGTYLDVRVRVHILFILFVGFQLLADLGTGGSMWWTLRWTSLLFGSVLLHEYGHALACRAVGGEANDILLWPLGGLAFVAPPRRPLPEFITVVCGPLVNVVIAAACFIVLLVTTTAMPVSLNPLAMWTGDSMPRGLNGVLADLFVVNYALLLFNLLLVFYPFDGGRMVQIGLWVWIGFRRSMMVATRVGMVGAVLVGLYGLAIAQQLLLVFIGIFGFYTCYRQAQIIRMTGDYGLATSMGMGGSMGGGYESEYNPGFYNDRDDDDDESKRPGYFARRRAERAARKEQAEREKNAQFDAEIDRILAKVKDDGLQSLTAKEKKMLAKATEQQRMRG